jgi:23S rRNA (adenine2030-N6)-methyltransferase
MNYRHAFHAGNFADLFKHSLLLLLIEHLQKKETPFRIIDSHAGRGFYNLTSEEALKTNEATFGVKRLISQDKKTLPHGLELLYTRIREVNQSHWPEIKLYPGSPALAFHHLRDHDRLILAELHPGEAWALRKNYRKEKKIKIFQQDGYELLKAQLPPPERRGLVLIDPPFENKDEFTTMLESLKDSLRRWPKGIYALWYPLKDPQSRTPFLEAIKNFKKLSWTAEFFLHPPSDLARFNGCGLVVINPPWQLDLKTKTLMEALQKIMEAKGPSHLQWLVQEQELNLTNPLSAIDDKGIDLEDNAPRAPFSPAILKDQKE